MFMWLNHWVYDFVAVTISNQPRHLAISADLVLQPIFIALFIFHIIFAFHASLEENNLRFLQKKVTIIKQSQHRKKRMFAQHHTRCYLKGNINLLYQEHTRSPECFSRSPWIQVDLSLHSFPFPLSPHWVCPTCRHRPGALAGEAFPSWLLSLPSILCHCLKRICNGQLWNAFAAKFESWQSTATTSHAGGSMERQRQFMYWFDNWFMCSSAFYRA